MSVRPAGPEDVAAVARLEQELFGTDAWSEASVAEELTGPRRQALVAVSAGGDVVGYGVTMLAGDTVDLQRIAVAPGARRTGVAAELLRSLRVQATNKGAGRMLLEVAEANAGARAFYAAHGFAEIDRRKRYYRDGSDALVLSAPLAEEGLTA